MLLSLLVFSRSGTEPPLIIDWDLAIEFGLMGSYVTKNLMALRNYLISKNDIKGLKSMSMILFDNDSTHYLYVNCYKQSYLQGLFAIKVMDFLGPAETSMAEERSRYATEVDEQLELIICFCCVPRRILCWFDVRWVHEIDYFYYPQAF